MSLYVYIIPLRQTLPDYAKGTTTQDRGYTNKFHRIICRLQETQERGL